MRFASRLVVEPADDSILELHQLAGLDIGMRVQAKHLEGARFRANHIAILHFRVRQRPQPFLVANGVNRVLAQHENRKRANQLARRLHHTLAHRPLLLLDHVQHDFAVACPLKNAASLLQFDSQLFFIDDLPVVDDGYVMDAASGHDGLDVGVFLSARRAVAHMADRHLPGHLLEFFAGEHVDCQAFAFAHLDLRSLADRDTARFLPPMLQRMQPVIRDRGRVLDMVSAKDATLFMDFIKHGSNSLLFRFPL